MLKQIVLGAFAVTVAATSAFAAERNLIDNSPFTGRQGDYHYADFTDDFCDIGDVIIKGAANRTPFKSTVAFTVHHGPESIEDGVTSQRICKEWVEHTFEDFFDKKHDELQREYGWIALTPIGGAAAVVELARAHQQNVEDLKEALDKVNANKHIPVSLWSDHDRNKVNGKGLGGYVKQLNTWVDWWDGRVDRN